MSGSGRLGSAMSIKQIAYAVRDGRQITFNFSPDWSIAGYVCGADDFHWMILRTRPTSQPGCITLVHKGSTPHFTIQGEATYDDLPEEDRAWMDPIYLPFRESVLREHFHKVASERLT